MPEWHQITQKWGVCKIKNGRWKYDIVYDPLIENYDKFVIKIEIIQHYCQVHPSGYLVPKWRRVDVDATLSRRIDVNTTSFYVMMPAGTCG